MATVEQADGVFVEVVLPPQRVREMEAVVQVLHPVLGHLHVLPPVEHVRDTTTQAQCQVQVVHRQ